MLLPSPIGRQSQSSLYHVLETKIWLFVSSGTFSADITPVSELFVQASKVWGSVVLSKAGKCLQGQEMPFVAVIPAALLGPAKSTKISAIIAERIAGMHRLL